MNGRAALLAVMVLAGCGAATPRHRAATHLLSSPPVTVPAQPPSARPPQIPNPRPTGIPASPGDVAVIRGWSDALRRGDVAAAARYFALPSEMINEAAGGSALVLRIQTVSEAVAAQETLPCGARLLSTDLRGQYVNALFALSGRRGPGGSRCGGGASSTARTNFVIAGGRIVKWIRAPSEPGDRGAPAAPSASPGSNSSV